MIKRFLLAAALGATLAMSANAQPKTMRIVVSFTSGGPVDSVARALSQQLGKELGRTVIIDNKPGANGAIGVPADLRELMILRVAVLNGAGFEYDAHVPHAEKAGVSKQKIDSVRNEQLPDVFAPLERLVLELTDAMTRQVAVPPELMARVQQHFDAKGVVEVVATVAAYNMVSRLLVALNVKH